MDEASVTKTAPKVLFKGADRNQILRRTRVATAGGDETWNHARGHVRKADRFVDSDAFRDLETHESREVGFHE